MPSSRNTRMRPKNTSRAEARRRHRDEQRQLEAEAEGVEADAPAQEAAAPQQRSMFAMPDVAADLRALPMVFRKPLVWLPFGLLLLGFGLELANQNGALPEGQLRDLAGLYVQFTLPPPPLVIFFIGGFVAPRASYLVGAILGVFYSILITILVLGSDRGIENAGIGEELTIADMAPLWAMGVFGGIIGAGFAAWYRRFLRSSQERAAANRAAREREQAEKAKQQAREDKAALRAQKHADRESRRKSDR